MINSEFLSLLARLLSNELDTDVYLYRKHLIFVHNNQQISISFSFSSPPFTLPTNAQIYKSSSLSELTQFADLEKAHELSKKEIELNEQAKSLEELNKRLLSLQASLSEREKILDNKERQLELDQVSQKSILVSHEQEKKDLAAREQQLNEKEQRLCNLQTELDAQQKRLESLASSIHNEQALLETHKKQNEESEMVLSKVHNMILKMSENFERNSTLPSVQPQIIYEPLPQLCWDMVEGADNYSIDATLNGESVTLGLEAKVFDNKLFIDLTKLTDEGEYIFSITAISEKDKLNSSPVNISYIVLNQD